MIKSLFGLLFALIGLVAEVGAVVSWFKRDDHACLGWILLSAWMLSWAWAVLRLRRTGAN